MSSEHIRTMVDAGKQLLLSGYQDQLGFCQYITDCRTIDLRIPRRSGKTTYIIETAKDISSLVVVHCRNMVDYYRQNGVPAITPDNIHGNLLRGISGFGFKLDCLFVDEHEYISTETIGELIIRLKNNGMLSKDFYIVKLGT